MEKPIFVAREQELDQLDGYLHQSIESQGSVCFVAGEAGSGKTALVNEFANRAQDRQRDLIVALGQCDSYTGSGDAYLPFREVLGLLTGDVESDLAKGKISTENANRLQNMLGFSGQALVELGPDLIGIFIPGAGLATRAAAYVAEKVGWLDKLDQLTKRKSEQKRQIISGIEQSHIFEQYVNVLNKLGTEHPLIIILDDLQWADSASIELLFHLGRRIEDNRILIIGTYRPEEVSIGRAGERHPLEKVLSEIKRYYGDVWIDLDRAMVKEGIHFVNTYLDTEPNQLGEGFRQALHHHTNGQPLFTIELLRDMQERGDLVKDEQDRWIEDPTLDWSDLPARVEGVIEERTGRLEGELRNALSVGSVEGEDFTAEVVARIQAADARYLITRLSGELEKQHRLVSAQGVKRIGSGEERLSLYRFQHNLFQTYLYGELDEVERVCLHEDVGNVLEELYGEQANEIAVQLARHFDEAGIPNKASHYLHMAGEHAAARFANDEALSYLARSLDLIPNDAIAEKYAILLDRERIYDILGSREAQAQDLESLEELADSLDDDLRHSEVALRQAHYFEITGDYPQAITIAQKAIQIAQDIENQEDEAVGYLIWGQVCFYQGNYEKAREQLEQTLTIARITGLHQVEADSLCSIGKVRSRQGDFSDAEAYCEQALQIYNQFGDLRGEAEVLQSLSANSLDKGDYSSALTHGHEALNIFRQVGYRKGEGNTLVNLGIIYAQTGDYTKGKFHLIESLNIHREVGDQAGEAACLNNLGNLANRQGEYAEAGDYFHQVLDICQQIGHRRGEGITLNNLGSVAEYQGEYAGALVYRQQALEIFRQIDDRNSEGLSLSNLGNLLRVLGDYTKARTYLDQALIISQEIGDRQTESISLKHLADLSRLQGDYSTARSYYDTCLQIFREIGDPKSECITLVYLGWLFHNMGDDEVALEYYKKGLKIGNELGDRSSQGCALTYLGHTYAAMGRFPDATDAYQQALTLRRELGEYNLTMESLAGIAYVLMVQEDMVNAQVQVEEILLYLENNTLDGTDEPLRVYQTCYRVLKANQDLRAPEVLTAAYHLLQDQASKISDDKLQRAYLENITLHQYLVDENAKIQ
jgi:predicted ATPase